MKNLTKLLICIIVCIACIRENSTKVNLNDRSNTLSGDSVSDNAVKIGIAAMLSPKEALPVYDEIVHYIGKNLGFNTEMYFTKDYATMNNLVREKKVVAAFVCAGPYVMGHDEWNMELIAAPVLYGQSSYYSYIIVNTKAGFKTLEDLKGKRFAFTDPNSNTGFIVPNYELQRLNIDPKTFFSECLYSGSHDKSIEAVANDLVDAASVDHLIWEYMDAQHSEFTAKTRILQKFGPYCSPPVVTYPDCDSSLTEKIRDILLNMHKSTEGKQILDKLYIDYFTVVDDSCYSSVRRMVESLD